MVGRARTLSASAQQMAANLAANATKLAEMDAQARVEMQQDPEFQQAYPEISTFFSNLSKYDQETQQKMLSQIQSEANAQVDGAFNTEEDFIKRLQAIKTQTIQDKLNLFKTEEQQSLAKNLGELSRSAGDTGSKNFANLASNNALDSGAVGSFADRLVESLTTGQKQEQDASAIAIQQAEQAAAADKSLADMTAEEQLFIGENSISARRATARSERYADLLGINASQDLLAQTPTALNDNMQTRSTARTTAQTQPASYLPSRVTASTSLRASPAAVTRTTPTLIGTREARAKSRSQNLLSTYGESSLNSRARSIVGLP